MITRNDVIHFYKKYKENPKKEERVTADLMQADRSTTFTITLSLPPAGKQKFLFCFPGCLCFLLSLFYGVSVCIYRYGVDGCIVKNGIDQALHHDVAHYGIFAVIVVGCV